MTWELQKADPDLAGDTKPKNMTEAQWKTVQEDKRRSSSRSGGSTSSSGDFHTLFDLMKKWEDNFGRHLQIMLDVLNHYAATETVTLLNLCARLSTINQGTVWAGLKADDDLA